VIARVWRGAASAADAEAYAAYVEQCLDGERALVLQRVDGDRAEIQTIIFFDSLDVVREFAGEDITRARFYPEDDRYLVDRDLTVTHYDVPVFAP